MKRAPKLPLEERQAALRKRVASRPHKFTRVPKPKPERFPLLPEAARREIARHWRRRMEV